MPKYIYKCNGKRCKNCNEQKRVNTCGWTLDEEYRADKEIYGVFHEKKEMEDNYTATGNEQEIL